MSEDPIEHFEKLSKAMDSMNREIKTTHVIDEEALMRRIEEKIKRGLAGRTTESRGV